MANITGGETAKTLSQGFSIAKGDTPNTYAGEMPGQVWTPSLLTMFGYNLPSQAQLKPFMEARDRGEVGQDVMFSDWQKTQGVGAMKSMEEYYTKFYGGASGPTMTATPAEEAAKRAKGAASGAGVGTAGTAPAGPVTGAGSTATESPWVVHSKEQSPWM